MTSAAKSPYAGYRFPGEVISHAVWLYFRFPLSLRMVEEMLAARSIAVSHETVRKGLGPGGSVLGGREVIAAEVEEIVDPVMGGEETLGLARRLEPLHLPLPSSGRLVRILCSVIQALMPPVLDRRHDLSLGGAVAGQLVRD